jgi:hypothetical protein
MSRFTEHLEIHRALMQIAAQELSKKTIQANGGWSTQHDFEPSRRSSPSRRGGAVVNGIARP